MNAEELQAFMRFFFLCGKYPDHIQHFRWLSKAIIKFIYSAGKPLVFTMQCLCTTLEAANETITLLKEALGCKGKDRNTKPAIKIRWHQFSIKPYH